MRRAYWQLKPSIFLNLFKQDKGIFARSLSTPLYNKKVNCSLFPKQINLKCKFSSTSSQGDINQQTNEDIRVDIIETALRDFVPLHGWSTEALCFAAEKHGLPGIAHGMFPNGSLDLVNYFIHKSNQQMLEKLKTMDLQRYQVTSQVLKFQLNIEEKNIYNH